MRLCAPNPMKPLTTVAPARPRLRASRTIASYNGFPCQRSASPTKIRSSLPSAGSDISCPQSDDSRSHLADDVEGCPEKLSVAQELERLERKRGERRESAEDADEEEGPRLGPQQKPLLRQPDYD